MTNSTNIAITMPEPSGYGAVELKEFIRRYTMRGFLITVGIFLLFFLLYFVFNKISEAGDRKPLLAPIQKIKLEDLPPQTNTEDVPPPPPQQIINTGPAARAGNPIPVPDAQITPDMKDFATIDVMSRASSVGGEGADLGGFASNINFDNAKVDVKVKEQEPAPDEFIPVEKEPTVDLEKLQKLIVYPDLARRAGVEGKVILRVLVDKSGTAKKMLIEASDNELLNDAAMKAIKQYGKFLPAIQNDQPISCWVSIPIQFRLR